MSCALRFLLFLILLLPGYYSHSQDRCSTVQYEEMRKLKNPGKESTDQFEKWINNKMSVKVFENKRTEDTKATIIIPVVVHIIHNGEAVGTGTNLSDAQIHSQINVLNKDYQRLNTDASNTPAGFLSVAGGLDIQFVLAKQDPVGAPTNGIVRVQGPKAAWSVDENSIFKALSYWPAEKYLNIWVLKFSDNTVGYAQFPVSNLAGMENSPDDRLTDGVSVAHNAFGSSDDGAFALDSRYSKGRTLTHEVGHFLGLRHIWGDDGSSCSGTDFVEDTPNQAGSYTNQCPTGTRTTCSTDDMYMNYMDYTNDACMNLFTVGQLGRVNVVLQNSPRRLSLLTSEGANEPTPIALDAAIKKIINPGTTNCGDALTPALEIQNVGTSTTTSLRVTMKVNSVVVETKDFSLSLASLQSAELQFSPYTPAPGSTLFSFEVLLVNGSADVRTFNNIASVNSKVAASASLPLIEDFNTMPSAWTIQNGDNITTWSIFGTSSNGNALFLNGYDYENQGAIDRITTPVIDLTSETFAFLKFDRAYEFYDEDYADRLRVIVSATCNFDNATNIIVFDKKGLELATETTSTGIFFEPDASQWKTEVLSLSQFIGSKIQIAFESINGYGNNQFLDNIAVTTDEFTDLALLSLESPSPVSCNTTISPSVKVKNVGSTLINSFKVQISANSQTPLIQTITNANLAAGEEKTFSLNEFTLQSGLNTVSVTLSDPNSLIDANSENNSKSFKRIINNTVDVIPLRENFEAGFASWSIQSEGFEESWITTGTTKGTSLAFTAFNNLTPGEQSWLVSPVLDMKNAQQASVFFETSYGLKSSGNEKLEVLYSTDCGTTFNQLLFSQSGSTLSNANSTTAWLPSSNSDWRKNYVNLNELAGMENLRLAFVATANNGNNLYLDNIEFFIDDDTSPVSITDAYSVYGSGNDVRITFNLAERQPVDLKIYNTMGQLVLNNTLPETLNQTYYFDIGPVSNGIYIVRVQAGNSAGAKRVYLGNR